MWLNTQMYSQIFLLNVVMDILCNVWNVKTLKIEEKILLKHYNDLGLNKNC